VKEMNRLFFGCVVMTLASCAQTPNFRPKADKEEPSLVANEFKPALPRLQLVDGTLNFYQALALPSNSKLDLLVVFDTSGSMSSKREAIAEGLKQFLERLPISSDINVALSLAHRTAPYGGVLYQKNSEPRVLRTELLSPQEIGSIFSYKLTGLPLDTYEETGEFVLGAFQLMILNTDLRSAAIDHGFLRQDAPLVVIFISDENDICSFTDPYLFSQCPSCTTPLEVAWGNKHCYHSNGVRVIQYATYFSQMRNLVPNRSLSLAAIIYTGENPVPSSSQTSIGHGIKEVVERSQGVLIDLGNPAPEPALPPNSQRIADSMGIFGEYATQYILNLEKVFQLPQELVVLPASIQVKVDGEFVESSFDSQSNRVFLTNAGLAGSHVLIEYQYLAEVP